MMQSVQFDFAASNLYCISVESTQIDWQLVHTDKVSSTERLLLHGIEYTKENGLASIALAVEVEQFEVEQLAITDDSTLALRVIPSQRSFNSQYHRCV